MWFYRWSTIEWQLCFNLGNPQSRAKFFHKTRQQYIVDRHIVSFEAIIYYYETGKLIAPTIYEPIIFFEELKYFQFDEETIQQFYQTEIHEELYYHERIVPSNKLFRAIWIALEYQDYSFLTQLVIINGWDTKRNNVLLRLDSFHLFNGFIDLLFCHLRWINSAIITW